MEKNVKVVITLLALFGASVVVDGLSRLKRELNSDLRKEDEK